MKVICTILFSLYFTLSVDAQDVDYPVQFSKLSTDVARRAIKHYNLLDSLEHNNASSLQKLRAQISATQYYTQERVLKSISDSLLSLVFSNDKVKEDPQLYAKAITTRGIAEYKKMNFEKAISSHYEAIAIREKEKDPSISYNYHLIGLNLMARERPEEALKNYLKAEQLGIHRKQPNAKLSQRIAHAYKRVDDFEKSEGYFLKSIEEAKQIKSQLIEGTSLSRLADLYSIQGKHQKAIELLEQSLVLREGKMGSAHKINLHHGFAVNQLALGDTKSARTNANKAYDIAKQINSRGYQQTVLRTLVDIDKKEGEKDSSIFHYEALLTARDSFFNLENANNFHELYTKLELGEKERAILKKEVIIQKENRTKNRLYMTVCFLTILSLMGGWLIRNKIKHEKKITEQNKIIKTALAEKDVLLKEIHHRVKNNLQIVSSLLGMQSLSIKDESVKTAITESRSRVHSMSLIHQNLYKKEKFSGIEMKPYIDQLCSNLINTYHFEEKEIILKTNVSKELWLDVETVVPLGLIINELITNSLKHAFDNRETGTITTNLNIENKILVLNVRDNGVGFNQEKNQQNTFGHSLIESFRHKLDASLSIENNNGTSVTLYIKSYSTV